MKYSEKEEIFHRECGLGGSTVQTLHAILHAKLCGSRFTKPVKAIRREVLRNYDIHAILQCQSSVDDSNNNNQFRISVYVLEKVVNKWRRIDFYHH